MCSVSLGPIESKCKDATPLNTACCNEHFPGCCRAYISADGKKCGVRSDFLSDKVSVKKIIRAGEIIREKDFAGAYTEVKESGKLKKGVTDCRASYKGFISTSKSGTKCVEWSKTPYAGMGELEIGFHNFCRNPDGDEQGIWCYVKEGSKGIKKEYCDPPMINKSENGKTCKETCSNPDGDPNGMWCTEEKSGEKAYCKESTIMLTQDQKRMKDCCPKEFPNCCESYIHGGTCSIDNKSKTGAINCTTIQNVKFPTQTQRGLTCKDWDSIDLSFDCPVGWEKFYEGKDEEDDESSEFLYCRRKSSPSEVCALGDVLGGVWGTKDAWATLEREKTRCPYVATPCIPEKINPRSMRGRGLGANFCRNPGDILRKAEDDTRARRQWGAIVGIKRYTENPDGGESKGMWCYTGNNTWDYCAPKFFFKTSGKPSLEDFGPTTAEECKERAGSNTFYKKGSWKKIPVNASSDERTITLDGEYPNLRGLEKMLKALKARISSHTVSSGKTILEFETELGPCKTNREMRAANRRGSNVEYRAIKACRKANRKFKLPNDIPSSFVIEVPVELPKDLPWGCSLDYDDMVYYWHDKWDKPCSSTHRCLISKTSDSGNGPGKNSPLDCFGMWTPWSSCTKKCGVGETEREYVVYMNALYGGKNVLMHMEQKNGGYVIRKCARDKNSIRASAEVYGMVFFLTNLQLRRKTLWRRREKSARPHVPKITSVRRTTFTMVS